MEGRILTLYCDCTAAFGVRGRASVWVVGHFVFLDLCSLNLGLTKIDG